MTVKFTESLEKGMELLYKRGAFLTVKDGDILNTMTISWGNIGYEWNRPIFTALIRKSRYTHSLIENAREFTVSIPFGDEFKESLAFCGTRTGRDFNKFEKCDLKVDFGKKTKTPVIANCGLIYECKVVYKQDMNLGNMNAELIKACYPDDDCHTFYYGEIVACYTNK